VPASAAAQDAAWYSERGDRATFARFGVEGTDRAQFEIECGKSFVTIRPGYYADTRETDISKMRYGIDGEAWEIRSRYARVPSDDGHRVETVIGKDHSLFDALKNGAVLTYGFVEPRAGDEPVDISLSGSARAINAMLDGC